MSINLSSFSKISHARSSPSEAAKSYPYILRNGRRSTTFNSRRIFVRSAQLLRVSLPSIRPVSTVLLQAVFHCGREITAGVACVKRTPAKIP
ncbi:hypothetical protein WJX77_003780 [Trebouxia sp. C0004]